MKHTEVNAYRIYHFIKRHQSAITENPSAADIEIYLNASGYSEPFASQDCRKAERLCAHL